MYRNNFEAWWDEAGSKIVPGKGDDQKEYAKKVALAAWAEMNDRMLNVVMLFVKTTEYRGSACSEILKDVARNIEGLL